MRKTARKMMDVVKTKTGLRKKEERDMMSFGQVSHQTKRKTAMRYDEGLGVGPVQVDRRGHTSCSMQAQPRGASPQGR